MLGFHRSNPCRSREDDEKADRSHLEFLSPCPANDPVNNLRGLKPTVERTPGWRGRARGTPPASITFARTTTGPVRFIDLLAGGTRAVTSCSAYPPRPT